MGRRKKEQSNMGSCIFPFLGCYTSSTSSSPSSTGDGDENIVCYSYKTLRTAAQGFQSSYKIGEGGFGSVYKGNLGDEPVAIKVLSEKSVQGEKEFLAEIESLRNVKHENLVRLRGYSTSENNKALVYDYMERSSLAQTLLSSRRCDINFTWDVRRKICLGVAHGLAYLHEEVKPRIIHRDIKPSNILLDANLTPKISDFGLAKLFPDNMTHISTRVAGTIGYLAPEYARLGKLTRQSDIYSYGVLLLEIMCGRSGATCAEDYSLVQKAWELYKEDQLIQLVDPLLSLQFPAQEANQYLKVALLCVQDVPKHRPAMSRVVNMLSNKIDTRDIQISEPAVISDLKIMKMGQEQRVRRTPLRHPKESTSSTTLSSMYSTDSSPDHQNDNSLVKKPTKK